MSIIGFFQSIFLFYQEYYNYSNPTLSEFIDLQIYTFEFFSVGRNFLIQLLQNKNFIQLTIEEIQLESIKIKTINNSILSFFYRKPNFFTQYEIQLFYQISNNLDLKIDQIINDITVDYKGLSINDNLKLQTSQQKYRSYILETFWPKYYDNLKIEPVSSFSGNNNINSSIISQREKRAFPIWEIEILYNKPKMNHFDFISSQFQLYSIKNKENKKGRLSFYGDPSRIQKIDDPLYTHNMIVKEINAKLEFSINQKDNIYYIKYDINTISIENVKRIFIYGYTEYKKKKILIGFAYRNNNHYREIYKNYYKYIL